MKMLNKIWRYYCHLNSTSYLPSTFRTFYSFPSNSPTKSISTTVPILQRRLWGVHWCVVSSAASYPLFPGGIIFPPFVQNPTPGAAPALEAFLTLHVLPPASRLQLTECYSSTVLWSYVSSLGKAWSLLSQFEWICKYNFLIGVKCLADRSHAHSIQRSLCCLSCLFSEPCQQRCGCVWHKLSFVNIAGQNSTVVFLHVTTSPPYHRRPQIRGSWWQHSLRLGEKINLLRKAQKPAQVCFPEACQSSCMRQDLWISLLGFLALVLC